MNQKNKEDTIYFRVEPGEKAIIQAAATASGMTLSEYARLGITTFMKDYNSRKVVIVKSKRRPDEFGEDENAQPKG